MIYIKICIYGTVYNNVKYVEESIKSIWRPDAEIIIVDSYSNDGTWEKLLELKKDFNLHLYRYKCSRGLGRNIALYKCAEKSITAYFDLDTIYSENFHKQIDAYEITGSIKSHGTLVISKEEALRKGGWSDLNVGEDTEFTVRMNPKVFVPIIVGSNANPEMPFFFREKRYVKNLLGTIKRFLKAHADYVEALGFDLYDVLIFRNKRLTLLSPLLISRFAKSKSRRLVKNMNNATLENFILLTRLIDPKQLGMKDKLLMISINYDSYRKLVKSDETIDKIVRRSISGKLYKLITSSRHFYCVYVKDFKVLLHIPFLIPLINKIRVIE